MAAPASPPLVEMGVGTPSHGRQGRAARRNGLSQAGPAQVGEAVVWLAVREWPGQRLTRGADQGRGLARPRRPGLLDQVGGSCLPLVPVTPIKASFWLGFARDAAPARPVQGAQWPFQHQHWIARLGGCAPRFHPDHRGPRHRPPGLGPEAAAIDLAAGRPYEQGARADPPRIGADAADLPVLGRPVVKWQDA